MGSGAGIRQGTLALMVFKTLARFLIPAEEA